MKTITDYRQVQTYYSRFNHYDEKSVSTIFIDRECLINRNLFSDFRHKWGTLHENLETYNFL